MTRTYTLDELLRECRRHDLDPEEVEVPEVEFVMTQDGPRCEIGEPSRRREEGTDLILKGMLSAPEDLVDRPPRDRTFYPKSGRGPLDHG